MKEFVYMLIEREFIKSKESVYKIGRTKDMKQRLQAYPKGSQLLLSSKVADSKYVEKQIMKTFKQKFKQRIDIGSEYFEGIIITMQKEFIDIVESVQQTSTSQYPILPFLMPVPEQESKKHSLRQLLPQNKMPANTSYRMHTCECGFVSSKKFNLVRHLQSKAHVLNMSFPAVNNANGNYECTLCQFVTNHKGHYREHVQSRKHATAIQSNSVSSSVSAAADVMSMILKQQENTQIQIGMIMKHHETTQQQNTDLIHQNTELVKALLADRATQPQNVMLENSQNTTITNNKSFNLQFFLNEECKNAMNFSDFIKTVSVTIEDIEHLGEVGYTQGMSKIITKALSETKVRPMHCTDTKRETIYVKENDAWHKDSDCEESKRLIENIARENYKALAEWRVNHPEHVVHDTEDHEAWYRISRNMCNTDPSALKKLIRHLAMVTAVEKDLPAKGATAGFLHK